MKKTQVDNEKEYREYTFAQCVQHEYDNSIIEAFGLYIETDCYDFDEKGNIIDEKGNIIPEDTPYNIEVYDWVKELQYPIIILEWIETDFWSNNKVVCVETVSIYEFK